MSRTSKTDLARAVYKGEIAIDKDKVSVRYGNKRHAVANAKVKNRRIERKQLNASEKGNEDN